jgi:hypothetical protein
MMRCEGHSQYTLAIQGKTCFLLLARLSLFPFCFGFGFICEAVCCKTYRTDIRSCLRWTRELDLGH